MSYNGYYPSLPSWRRGFDSLHPLITAYLPFLTDNPLIFVLRLTNVLTVHHSQQKKRKILHSEAQQTGSFADKIEGTRDRMGD